MLDAVLVLVLMLVWRVVVGCVVVGTVAVGCWMLVRGGVLLDDVWLMVVGVDGECCCGGIGRVVLGVAALLLISWE